MELTAPDSDPIMIRPCGLRRVRGSFGDQIVAEQGSAGNQGDGLRERTRGRRGGSRFEHHRPAGGRLRPGTGARGSADAHARSGRALRSLISRSAVRAVMRSHRALDRSRLGPPGTADRAPSESRLSRTAAAPKSVTQWCERASRFTGFGRLVSRSRYGVCSCGWSSCFMDSDQASRCGAGGPRAGGRGTDDGLRTGPGEARGEAEGGIAR